MEEVSTSNGNKILGFGKYSGLTYEELAQTQPGYIHWLFRQSWFMTKYPELYDYLDQKGLSPFRNDILSSNEEPLLDHNEFQAKFTDDEELLILIKSILGNDYSYNITNVVFEHHSNADILIDVERIPSEQGWFLSGIQKFTLSVELKPSMSNDYPEVLRQMRAQERSLNYFYSLAKKNLNIQQVLVIQRYTGDIPFEKVRKIFGDILIVQFSGSIKE